MMTALTAQSMNDYEPLFGYGQLRGVYLNSDMSTGQLHIKQFVREEHVTLLREALLSDRHIFMKSPNTLQQAGLSPVSRQCLWELHSGIMLRVLENITGIHNLLPDTHCHSTELLPAPCTDCTGTAHETPTTGLVNAITILLLLDSGDALLCTDDQLLENIRCDSPVLRVSYWQHIMSPQPDQQGAH